MRILIALISGIVFGIGLTIADMTNPAKVQNFLDIVGSWDPSLIFVMGGGVIVAFIGFRLIRMRQRPLLAEQFYFPTAERIDGRLIAGSALFGIGWGLSGFCPGPAIAGLAWANPQVFIFVAAVAAGAMLVKWFAREDAEALLAVEAD
jgi:uncharacterized protein